MENKKISQLDPYSGNPDSFDIPGVADGQTLKTNLGAAIQRKINSECLLRSSDLKTVNGVPLTGQGDIALELTHPFKGWYDNLAALQAAVASPAVGDYAYIKSAIAGNPAAIYECTTAGTWSDSGRTVDTSNVQTFGSGQQVNAVKIRDENGVENAEAEGVLSAEAGELIAREIFDEVTEEETVEDVTITKYDDGYWASSNGNFVSEINTSCSNKIQVTPGEVYKVTLRTSTSTLRAYLGEWGNNTWIGVADGFTGGSVVQLTDVEYIVPDGVDEIALTSLGGTWGLKKVTRTTAVVPSFYKKAESDERYATKPELAEALTEDDIVDNLDSSDPNKVPSAKQAKVLGDAVFEDRTIVEPFPVEMHSPNGYYYKSGGVFVSSEGQRATNKISVFEGEKFYVTTIIGSAASAVCILGEWNGDTFVGTASGFENGTGNAVDRPYTVPTGVTHIAVCSNSTTAPTLKKDVTVKAPKFYNKTESDARYIVKDVYGVKWSTTDFDDLGTRILEAVGKTARIGIGNQNGASDFDNIYPWSEMKRCNINKNINGATIVTFEGEDGFELDGTNGDVFVRIPKFKYKRYVEDGYEYVVIGDGVVHPAFIEDGIELDEIFIAAFEASKTGDPYSDAEGNGDGKIYSKAGVIPANNITASSFLSMATAKGKGYSLYDNRCVDMLWCLMAVEFGCRNSNQILGWGYANYLQPDQTISSCRCTETATNTNSITLGIPGSNSKKNEWLDQLAIGNIICICEDAQTNIIAERRITNVTCASASDNLVVEFDGNPIDVNAAITNGSTFVSGTFAGNGPIICGNCEEIGSTAALTWHTGRTNRTMLNGWGANVATMNSCRYRWIENLVGNVWHFLPDITFYNLQMYRCNSMEKYEMHKHDGVDYIPIGALLPAQSSNGNKPDVNSVSYPNFWITSLLYDYFYKGIIFGKTFDEVHDESITSTKGYGGYYYLYGGETAPFIISNGGGYDHLWRCNMLTNRAWQSAANRWYLYGARLMFKNI